jgi:hypothetical protein
MKIPAGFAAEMKAGHLMVEHAWARPTIGNAPNSAAYLKITNKGGAPHTLTDVKSDVAEKVQLHMVMKEGEVMRMRPVKGGIAVPANASLELKPGGYHIMLIGLTKKLTLGDMFDLTLQFKGQGDVLVKVMVQKMGGKGSGAMKHGHGHGAHGQ